MVYDSFLFYNELDVLEIRLNTLDSVVDKFVIAEATVTHTNKPKPLYFNENKKRFSKFQHKIIHIIIKDSPSVTNPWILERYQFTEVGRGLKNCKGDDVILHGPVDEIPNPQKIIEFKNKPGRNKVFLMKLSFFYLNLVSQSKNDWEGTHMFKYKDLKYFKDIYFTRYLPTDVKIKDGGWHFSYIGDIKFIQKKMESMAHQEFNNAKYNTPEKIKQAIAEGTDLFGMELKFKPVDLNLMPMHVRQNKEKYKKILISKMGKKDKLYPAKKLAWLTKDYIREIYKKNIKNR